MIGVKTNKDYSATQLGDCLATFNQLMPWLVRNPDATPVDTNVQTSIESTVIRVLNRIDKLIDDDSRFTLPKTDLQEIITRTAEVDLSLKELEFLHAQTNREIFMAKVRAALATPDLRVPAEQPEPSPKPPRRRKRKNENE